MEKKLFDVKIFYTGYCSYKIQAMSKEDAIIKARNLEINKNELLNNLENWEEADEANEIENEKRSS